MSVDTGDPKLSQTLLRKVCRILVEQVGTDDRSTSNIFDLRKIEEAIERLECDEFGRHYADDLKTLLDLISEEFSLKIAALHEKIKKIKPRNHAHDEY